MTSIDYPKEFQSKTEIHKIITKLANVNNSRVDQVLGKYYLKHEKVWLFLLNYITKFTINT